MDGIIKINTTSPSGTATNDLTNRLDLDTYLLSPNLHSFLHGDDDREKYGKDVVLGKGVFLVCFRLLNNSDKPILIYNYTYYHISSCYSIVVYFILRNYYIKNSFKDRGYYFVMFDNKFLDIADMGYYMNTGNDLGRGINLMWLFDELSNYLGEIDRSDAKSLLNFTTKLMYINNTEAMSIIKCGVDKDFFSFMKLIYQGRPLGVGDNFASLSQPKFSVLNSTLFVVENLEHLVKQVVDKGFIISQGPQKWRGQLNSMHSYLGGVDMDYRDSLYNHYMHHYGYLDPYLYSRLENILHFQIYTKKKW